MSNPYAGTDYETAWSSGFDAGHSSEDAWQNPAPPEFPGNYGIVWQEGALAAVDGESTSHEWWHLGADVAMHAIAERAYGAIGGLASLVITVLQIPGDAQLRPLESDWSGPADQEGDLYFALCTQMDHPMLVDGATSDGGWVGPPRSSFAAALTDAGAHHHRAVVARCSMSESTCGIVTAEP